MSRREPREFADLDALSDGERFTWTHNMQLPAQPSELVTIAWQPTPRLYQLEAISQDPGGEWFSIEGLKIGLFEQWPQVRAHFHGATGITCCGGLPVPVLPAGATISAELQNNDDRPRCPIVHFHGHFVASSIIGQGNNARVIPAGNQDVIEAGWWQAGRTPPEALLSQADRQVADIEVMDIEVGGVPSGTTTKIRPGKGGKP